MKDRVFFDTNLLVYFYTKTEQGKYKILNYILKNQKVCLSSQVIQEFSNVMIKKFKISESELIGGIKEIEDQLKLFIINIKTIKKAVSIKFEYKYSFYDSLIIAAALESDCKILYSEDLQHNQIIARKLKIINPFKK